MKFVLGYFWTQVQTTIHKFWVAWYILQFVRVYWEYAPQMLWRAFKHDLSKYRWVEAAGFAKTVFDLKRTTYGTPAYKALLDQIQPCLQHHYKRNSHHPEYWPNGYQDMSFLDRVEMLCDWRAAVRRHADGNILKSIEHNQKRFGYTDYQRRELLALLERMQGADGYRTEMP